jgi:hypothetical protein
MKKEEHSRRSSIAAQYLPVPVVTDVLHIVPQITGTKRIPHPCLPLLCDSFGK